ncbi:MULTISPECIES: hypothetical protein [Sinorhizobium]|jgi:hypothetical protein|nr:MULTISPECIES: hypothetical protein [Sinorhizobium]ASP55342.1 hypothetical protein CDO31_28680 [Sinorhizobium meliloti]ASP69467.1 hypothetical protein CDO29_30635 [Sinorhizobium meliloti]ASP82554.1 hypothetical protein CDO27_33055 [Sinorhizobium meliloti]ASP95570.1 hypothetical protein CDO25_28055 [Sinorhizobium meliloti]KKA13588.1 hypothetical protein VP03_13115 [Sinorhizobium meliloti]
MTAPWLRLAIGFRDMHFLTRRLEAFNRDDLPDWRRSPSRARRALSILPSLVEYSLFYALALIALTAVIALMAAAWIVDRRRV